jgi:hypothetical protein
VSQLYLSIFSVYHMIAASVSAQSITASGPNGLITATTVRADTIIVENLHVVN